MKLFSVFLLLSSLLLAQQQELTILHWNDFHSQNLPYQVKSRNRSTNSDTTFFVGGSAAFASYLKKHRTASENVLVLHGGDDFQGSPISTITKGKSQIDLLNLLKPDAMQLGNHEFDYGRHQLIEHLKSAVFQVLSSNIIDDNTDAPFAPPYVIKQIGTLKVGIIGVMSTELSTLSLPDNVKGLTVRDPSATINSLIPELKKQQVDIIIALSHLGVYEDSVLAMKSPDVDVIVGGHTHTPLFRPKVVNGVVITQAGSRGRWLGKISLTVDTEKDTIVKSFAELIECRTADVAPDSIVAATVDALESLAAKELNETIGTLALDWKREGSKESNIGNWITDALREYAKADIAFQNSGGIRKELLAGNIIVRDLWEISPFGNTLVTFSVDGATLRKMVQHQLSLKDDFCQVSGLQVVYKIVNGQRMLYNLKVNNALVSDTKSYSIVTNNYVAAQSKKYFGIDLTPGTMKLHTVADRDVLIEAVKKQKVIRSVVEGRIKETEE